MNQRFINIPFFFSFILIIFQAVSCKRNEPVVNSPYISAVFAYVFAPGQNAKAANPADTTSFKGAPSSDKGWLYLGGFGGYVIAGFDHDVINGAGPDFEVYNLQSISPEPAIVYVMPDSNGNGKPDDTWYELKGNQFSNSKRNYRVTYYKAIVDSANIRWKDNEGNSGELISGYGSKFSSGWWWKTTQTDSISFQGTCLPNAYINQSTDSIQYWVVPDDRFTWGYAENVYGQDFDSVSNGNKLDISNAVDSLGNPVTLNKIRFIKVQTAVFQQAGWLNEVSSEIRGAKDLHF